MAERLAHFLAVPADQREIFIERARGLRPMDSLTLANEPAPPPIANRSSNLPALLTPLIGRADEIASIKKYILNPGTRLLTLTGPPGIGKTRLSLQIASELCPNFEDGVYFVPLAPVLVDVL